MTTKLLASIFIFIFYQSGLAQGNKSIRGQVYFDKTAATKVEVINATAKTVTLTNAEGKFTIGINVNDQLVFVAKNHEIKEMKISIAVLNQGDIKISLSPKVEELKEVIVQSMPSIKLSKDAKWEKEKISQYALEKAAATPKVLGVYTGSIENGITKIIRLYSRTKEAPQIEFKDLAKSSCDQKFYIETLKLKSDEIALFLQFCEADPKSKTLLENSTVLSMMDFLSIKNIEFKKF